MATRTILYGYEIRDGQRQVCQSEAETVRQIFSMYRNGLSYQKTAETLNQRGIPYGESGTAWNKGKIKRMLEDRRYIGERNFPAIIDRETFEAVQTVIGDRSASQIPKAGRTKDTAAALKIHRHLRCADCDKPLIPNGSGGEHSGDIYLRCPQCGMIRRFSKSALLGEIERQIKEHGMMRKEYQPSAEAVRLANGIQRGLENPEQPEEVMAMILQAVSARYKRCPEPVPEMPDTLADLTAKQLSSLITHITIAKDLAVTVHFR